MRETVFVLFYLFSMLLLMDFSSHRCLFEFEDRFTSDVTMTASLWKYLMMALSGMTNDSLSRFAVVRKSLRLIKHHAFLFRRLIVLNMATSYRMTLVCYFSDREACKKHAEAAFIALLSEFSADILSNTLQPSGDEQTKLLFQQANQLLVDILCQFLKYLGNRSSRVDQGASSSAIASAAAEGEDKSSSRKISLGVKGITAVAPAVAIAHRHVGGGAGSEECGERIIGTLVHSCESLLLQMAARGHSERGEEGGVHVSSLVFQHDSEVILRKAQFVSAVSTTMYSLLCAQREGGVKHGDIDASTPSISSSLMSFLLGSGVDISLAYSRLSGNATPTSARTALCVLLQSVAFCAGSSQNARGGKGGGVLSCPEAAVSSVLDEALSTLVPLLLTRAMSRAEEGELRELHSFTALGEADQRLHFAYVPLWKELLCPRETETCRLLRLMEEGALLVVGSGEEGEGASDNDFPRSYQQTVFPSLIISLLAEVYKAMQVFDLSYILPSAIQNVEGEDSVRPDSEGDDQRQSDGDGVSVFTLLPLPNNAADHELLLNLVTFLEEISPTLLSQFKLLGNTVNGNFSSLYSQVREWLSLLLRESITLSRSWPMVSGLYRLCSFLSAAAESLVPTTSGPAAEKETSLGKGTGVGISEEQAMMTSGDRDSLLITYFRETALHVLQSFHHPELVSSALSMVFSAPVALMTQEVVARKVYLPLLARALLSGVQLKAALGILFIFLDFDASNDYHQKDPSSGGKYSQPHEEVLTDAVLKWLLPLLDKYLAPTSSSSSSGIEGKQVVKSQSKKKRTHEEWDGSTCSSFMLGGEEMSVGSTVAAAASYGTANVDGNVDGEEGEVQLLVLRFLARLGGRNKYLLQTPSSAISRSLQWACFNRQGLLSVHIPVTSEVLAMASQSQSQTQSLSQSLSQRTQAQSGGSLAVNVGVVVPRLVELCTDTADRQLRLYAQESLHAVALLMIGKVSQVTGADSGSSGPEFVTMFTTLFPTILALSASDDAVTKKLFDKLLYQTIHWLSSSCAGQTHLCDIYSSLLDHLIDGTSGDLDTKSASAATVNASDDFSLFDHSGSDSSTGYDSIVLRDQCVAAVVECFRWACKNSQVSKSENMAASDATTSVDGILARLLTLSTHPLERKRLGAVRVLNQLYVYFREDLALVHKYALRVVFVVLNAVKPPQRGGSSSPNQSQCQSQATCALAVSHYVKIIVRVSEKDEKDAAFIR